MKIPILVFCLTVIFGNISCRIYSNENVDLIEGTAGDENYDMNYFDVPSEKSLSRYKRASTLSPITDTLIDTIETDVTDLIQSLSNLVKFIEGLLTGQKGLCPMGNLSVEQLIKKLFEEIKHPIQAIETIICFIYNSIGEETSSIASTLSKTISKFTCTIFLPGLHKILGEIDSNSNLPANIKTLISLFNTFYPLIQTTCNNK
ncbi:uncharacterized protein LOC105256493 [Camponotus floridanus]|uniref:uncharacterized protein LOC105256493 n=1 Tax=Camponotus floridanus TaxID=104421 RepID=UPI00059DAA8A|nr:uncharacterized protein LOC105256493 [Camponotus floridanus]